MDKTSLGNRMKAYESSSKLFLTRRTPVIVRLDGKAFHSLTKKMDKPYDEEFASIMMQTAGFLLENVMGCKLAYVQSDEISLLIIDYEKIETDAWYGNNLQKIVSVSASLATAKFNELYVGITEEKKIKDLAFFDSRAFIIPKEEVVNYFVWRQNDATRNSIQGLGQAHFSQKEMHGKKNSEVQDMLMLQREINWNDIETYFKRGGCVYRGVTANPLMVDYVQSESAKQAELDIAEELGLDEISLPKPEKMHVLGYEYSKTHIMDVDIPIFTKDRDYIQAHVDCSIDRLLNRTIVDVAASLLSEDDYGMNIGDGDKQVCAGVYVSAGGISKVGELTRDCSSATNVHEFYSTQGCGDDN